MKFKHNSKFNQYLGEIKGIAKVAEHQATAQALREIAKGMEELWDEITVDEVAKTTHQKLKTTVGPVQRPTAERLRKKGTQDEASDKAMTTTLTDLGAKPDEKGD